MSNHGEKRFNEARQRLADALKHLEQIIISKIHETSIASKIVNNDNDDSVLRGQIIEQNNIIENLHHEINQMQKAMEEIGKESEFSKEKNRFFADKMFKFKSQGSNLIQAIENDLIKIQEIIKE